MTDSATSPAITRAQRRRVRQRTAQLRQALAALDLLVSGTVYTRYRTCGKPNCRCATQPEARHGPYYQWSHRVAGRSVHQVVSAQQAQQLREAAANYRRVRELLEQWEGETIAEIFASDSPSERKS